MNLLHYAVLGVLALEGEASASQIATTLDAKYADVRSALGALMVLGHVRAGSPIRGPSMYELAPKEER